MGWLEHPHLLLHTTTNRSYDLRYLIPLSAIPKAVGNHNQVTLPPVGNFTLNYSLEASVCEIGCSIVTIAYKEYA